MAILENNLIDASWNPQNLSEYESFFKPFINTVPHLDKSYELSKNISCSLQYIEYLLYILRPVTHVVVKKQIIKTIVINGTAIIEALLFCILLKKHY